MTKKPRIATDATDAALGQNPFGALEVSGTPAPAPDRTPDAKMGPAKPPDGVNLSGRIELRREKAGRGGKTATTARGQIFQNIGKARCEVVLKELKAQFGTGGSLLADGIEIRGDCRDALEAYLTERGAKVVRAGG
ncbi:MAG: translation initiation factor [Opitutales bacterium]